MSKMRRHAGEVSRRTSPRNDSSAALFKKSPTSRRPRPSSAAALPRIAIVGFSAVALLFLVGVHVYLLVAVTSKSDSTSSNALRIPTQPEHIQHVTVTPLRDVDLELYTIRMNTWQRVEQLLVSIEHHESCPGVAQIQVVWCEESEPPAELVQHPKVIVERHTVNSLNERFHIMQEAPTMGILSIDDDVLRPCEAIDSGFFKWTQNPHRMVGFDARTHVEDDKGVWKYGYMSTTEKSNRYSFSLTRYCFLHRDYLNSYMTDLPRPIFQHVHQVLNCEDIAMSFWVSLMTEGRPPLLADNWAMKSMVKLYSPERISGGHSHKHLRDDCVESFAQQLGLKGVLQRAEIYHKHKPYFETGAKGDQAPANWRVVDRHAALQKKVHHWKHLSDKKVLKQFGELKVSIMRQAYVHGLIQDSPPWERRWKK